MEALSSNWTQLPRELELARPTKQPLTSCNAVEESVILHSKAVGARAPTIEGAGVTYPSEGKPKDRSGGDLGAVSVKKS